MTLHFTEGRKGREGITRGKYVVVFLSSPILRDLRDLLFKLPISR